jgi:hypothetical protein
MPRRESGKPANDGFALETSVTPWKHGVSEGIGMPKIALPLLFFFNFGPPIFWGFVGAGISAPLLWSGGMAIFAILAGWRAPGRGLFTSVLIGLFFATVVNVPIYFIGRWLATSA